MNAVNGSANYLGVRREEYKFHIVTVLCDLLRICGVYDSRDASLGICPE